MTALPLRTRSARFWKGWGLAFGLSTLVVVLATLPPFLSPGFRDVLMQGFSSLCHQIPGRSPHIDGVQLAVCHRCYGIYAGLPLAVLGFLALSRWDRTFGTYAPYILVASLVPAGIDWGLGLVGVWDNTPASRLATGILFGLVAGYYLARALTEAVGRKPSDVAPAPAEGPAAVTTGQVPGA